MVVDTRLCEEFSITLPVTIRPARHEDLEALEWFGMFREHREIIRNTYEAQERGAGLMLIAEANRAPIGQLWIDLEQRAEEKAGLLWAIRVFPKFQRLGIGGHLLRCAEEILRDRSFAVAELGVETHNQGARRFYERYGYTVVSQVHEEYSYTTPDGMFMRVPTEQWVMRKSLLGEVVD